MREWRSGGVTGGFEERLRTLANQHAAIAEFGKIALVGIDPALLMVDAVETVAGAMGEEMAIATLKSGATDYVLKNRLSNLVPAVQKAIRQAEQRARTTQMAVALKESEERFRMLVEGVKDYAIFMLDPESRQADKVLLLILLLILISPGRRGARLRARSRVRSSLLSIIQQQSLNPSRQTSPQVQDNHS